MSVAAFTIVAKNYLPFARVLMASLRKWAPDVTPIVILVDHPDGYFDPAREDFDVILSETLPIPNSRWFHFKYGILEVCTAIKPFAFEYIFERYSVDGALYFDPDIEIYNDLTALLAELRDHSVLVTPHLTAPLEDERRPTDLDILRSGSYNLGFLGVSRRPESAQFLSWWKSRLYDHCVVDMPRGLFVDQRWIDLVPGMFPGVKILRDPGLNVAYWNLSHREVKRTRDGYTVNGEPLRFFHFSGLQPDRPRGLSVHQNRFSLDDIGDARELVLQYRGRLYDQGYTECSRWPYAFGAFENGFAIPDVGRPTRFEAASVIARLSDPFSEEGYKAFIDLWNQPIQGPDGKPSEITRLAYRIYTAREEVQQAMPDVFGGDLVQFLSWVLSDGRKEFNLSDVLTAPIADAVEARKRQEAERGVRPKTSAPVVHEKVLRALQVGGIWLSNEPPVQVETLNDLIGSGRAKLQLSRLAAAIYDSRPDLHHFFPDPCGRDSVRFLLWFLTCGAREYKLSETLIAPLKRQWDAVVASLNNPLERAWYRLVLQVTARSIGLREAMKSIRGRFRLSPAGQGGESRVPEPAAAGVNVIGYVRSEMGVGESVRCAIRAARAAQIPVAIRTVDEKGPYRLGDRYVAEEDRDLPHEISLFYVNADQAEHVERKLGQEFVRGRYNIGFWAWELEEFPDRWLSSFRLFDEIWTPSTFTQSAIARKSPAPVLRTPLAIEVDLAGAATRADFSIPADRFVFLSVFDLLSVPERKNPIGAITAFREAFGDSKTSHLVLKVLHGGERPRHMAAIAEAAAGLPVTIIDRTIDRAALNGLLATCDCLLSLHRSEGFGLSIAEAMYLEKPVVVTGYSGNLDFTKPDNSFLVEYDLGRVPKGCDPYEEGRVWAEPRIVHAVEQMRLVASSAEQRAERARRAAEFVRRRLSPAAVGQLMRERLELILSGRWMAEGPRSGRTLPTIRS